MIFAPDLPAPAWTGAAVVRHVAYSGRTSDGTAIDIDVAGARITRVTVVIGRYVCDPEGDIGPIRIAVRPQASDIHAGGVFGISAGVPSERLRIDGRFTRERRVARGSLRLIGTIGPGDRCRSARITFRVTRGPVSAG